MPIEHFSRILNKVNNDLKYGLSIPKALQPISVDLFGLLLWRKPHLGDYPFLQKIIPDMPSPEIQAHYVGASGEALLPMTCAFVNYIERMAGRWLAKKLTDAEIIDYGCGWGRHTRFLLKFVDVSRIRALDPNDEILRVFDGTLLSVTARKIAQIPLTWKGEKPADIIFLFSILTHTPEHVTKAISSWVTNVLVKGGLMIFTIRPKAYWRHHKTFAAGWDAVRLAHAHDERGISYMPQGGVNEDFGDASYADERILKLFPAFDVVDRTFSILDPLQIHYTLKKR